VTIHVDDLKISCVDSRGVDDVLNELKRVYGNINVHKEDVFDYLGMEFDYSNVEMKFLLPRFLELLLHKTCVKLTKRVNYWKVRRKRNFTQW